jgi:hypothetical protein
MAVIYRLGRREEREAQGRGIGFQNVALSTSSGASMSDGWETVPAR